MNVIKTAVITCIVVGSVLVLINHWECFQSWEKFQMIKWWKVGLTFMVPYFVASHSASRVLLKVAKA